MPWRGLRPRPGPQRALELGLPVAVSGDARERPGAPCPPGPVGGEQVRAGDEGPA